MANYIIDLTTKEIEGNLQDEIVLVKGEHLSQAIVFECPQTFGSTDLSTTNIAIHSINADGISDIDVIQSTDITVSDGVLEFSWKPKQIFTKQSGVCRIAVQFYTYADSKSKEYSYCLRTKDKEITIEDSFISSSNISLEMFKYERFLTERKIPYENNKVFIIDNKDIVSLTRESSTISVEGDSYVTKLYFIMNDVIEDVSLIDLYNTNSINSLSFSTYYSLPNGIVSCDNGVTATFYEDDGYILLTWEIPNVVCAISGNVDYNIGFTYISDDITKRWNTKLSRLVVENGLIINTENIGDVNNDLLQEFIYKVNVMNDNYFTMNNLLISTENAMEAASASAESAAQSAEAAAQSATEVEEYSTLQDRIDDLETFVGYSDEDIYGVEVDYANKKFTRLAGAEGLTAGADFDNLTPWGGRKRCIVADDGTVLAYYGEIGYTETGALTSDVVDAEGTVLYAEGTAVQVMVEQPIFYTKTVPVKSTDAASGKGKQGTVVRYYISPTPKSGFEPMMGFRDANGSLQDKIYLSAYEGCLYDTSADTYITDDSQVMDTAEDMLSSIADVKPMSSLTRSQARIIANNRGAGWQLHNIFALTATQWLILVEYASFDSQTKIAKGAYDVTDDGSTNMAINTGGTASLGNGSGVDPDGTDGYCCISYRGEENFWGNIWTFIDGVNVYNTTDESTVYLKEYGEFADDTADGYIPLAFEAIQSSGYISCFGVDSNIPQIFIPTECEGTSALIVSDRFRNQGTGWHMIILGGKWNDWYACGAWNFDVNYSTDYCYRGIGCRLLYIPQTTTE